MFNCRTSKYRKGLCNSAREFWQVTVQESETRAVGPTAPPAGSLAFLLNWETKPRLVAVKCPKI